jgi:hypothetical protein
MSTRGYVILRDEAQFVGADAYPNGLGKDIWDNCTTYERIREFFDNIDNEEDQYSKTHENAKDIYWSNCDWIYNVDPETGFVVINAVTKILDYTVIQGQPWEVRRIPFSVQAKFGLEETNPRVYGICPVAIFNLYQRGDEPNWEEIENWNKTLL